MHLIIQHKLTRQDNRCRINSIKNINQPRSLLRNSLQRIRIPIARRHPLRSGLQQCPCTLAYRNLFGCDGKEEGSAPATKGVAVYVPDLTPKEPSVVGNVERMFPPGAATAGLK